MLYLRGVTTLQLNAKYCNGCGVCLQVCPRGVLEPDGSAVRIRERDACIECGACALNCAVEALKVRAGVGCASALINQSLGREEACCQVE